MKLVIAEKPSVAMSIGKVLGATSKKDGYIEGNGYIVSWCVGHLVGLAPAGAYDEKYEKWALRDLPIIPKEFQYAVTKEKQKQLQILSTLLNQDNVAYVVNACDAGREGELIFRLVYQLSKSTKPVKRLWISSMEDVAIQNGFSNLKDGAAFDALYQAAYCRQQADWLVGINATRLFSCLYNQQLNVGRVMSPTLAMVVERNAQIGAFQPETFYHVQLFLDNTIFSSERIKELSEAEKCKELCKDIPLVVLEVEEKSKTEKPPKLYDLTTLQREANRKLGFTATQTLEYTQSLYEKKLVTYPRTDSRFLTEDMETTLPKIVESTIAAMKAPVSIPTNTTLVINNQKVTDHHAIITTSTLETVALDQLPFGEKAVFSLIALRLLSALGEPYQYNEMKVVAKCGEATFTAKGKTVTSMGFKIYENLLKTTDTEDVSALPTMIEGEVLEGHTAEIKKGETTPPKQFTEDTLLLAMENAGCNENVDKELGGIGTPATRASVIEKLIKVNLLERKGSQKTKYLIPTNKGIALISILPEVIGSPLTTAKWEEKLKAIELGELSADGFLAEIADMVKSLIGTYEVVKGSDVLFPRTNSGKIIGKCPRCGKDVLENKKGYCCEDKACGFALWKENKFFTAKKKTFTEKMAKDLISKGKIKLTGCYSEKTGKTYDCTVVLDDDGGKYVGFKMEFGKKDN